MGEVQAHLPFCRRERQRLAQARGERYRGAMTQQPSSPPLVVGIGGTIGGVSSTERALRIALDAAER